jgi:hypothetical protein
MPTANIWRVTITRLDKSKHRYSQPHSRQPRRGEIIETVISGKWVGHPHAAGAVRSGYPSRTGCRW